MNIPVTAEQKQKAIRLYKNKSMTIKEISNLTNISESQLSVIFRQAFEMGVLKPRNENLALKPRVPSGQGKTKYVATGKKRGNPNFKPKFTREQEQEIAIDYYERDFTLSGLKEKWGIHPMQLQRIRKEYGTKYGEKPRVKTKRVLQFDKQGNFVAEFESGTQASRETGICYQNINQCCNEKVSFAGGYSWRFKETI